jgi:hypothetical protein
VDAIWIPVISTILGGVLVLLVGVINGMISDKKEQEKHKRDDEQRWFQSRKNAYYNFIEVFSKPLIDEDIIDYLKASLDAAEYGDIILSDQLKAIPTSIAFKIESLDHLLAALIFMRSMHVIGGSEPGLAKYKSDFENLRKDALTPFLNEFMNILRQSGSSGRVDKM